jgi:hypothetical protein
MPIQTPPVKPTAPTVPDRSDRANFPIQMYNEHVFLNGDFMNYVEAAGDVVENNATEATTQATTATTKAAEAAAASAIATAAANTDLWVSGTTYTQGTNVISPINWHTYRRITNGGGTTDPSADPTNWKPITVDAFNTAIVSANATASVFVDHILTASLTLTLPASPAANDWVGVKNRSGTTTCVIDPGAAKIEGTSGTRDIDILNFAGRLVYVDATRGWVFL